MDGEATWLETASILALWLAFTLLTVFLTYVLWRASDADAFDPVTITAQDVSLKVKGGDDYTCLHGHTANQYERDLMEQTLLGVWMPRVLRYMRGIKACQSVLHSAETNLSVVRQRLNTVHQYDDIGGPPPKTWQVTTGGRHYQIEYYRMQAAQSCSVGSGAADCAAVMVPDMADLLDIKIVDGKCVKGADFVPPPDCQGTPTLEGIADGRLDFDDLGDADVALADAAAAVYHGTLCGETPGASVKAAQNAFIATAPDASQAHFRTPQDFTGDIDPLWTPTEVCQWKELTHREYIEMVTAWKAGNWKLARCFGRRHSDMHWCLNYKSDTVNIRMSPCTDPMTYPDLTAPMTCADYLASQYPL